VASIKDRTFSLAVRNNSIADPRMHGGSSIVDCTVSFGVECLSLMQAINRGLRAGVIMKRTVISIAGLMLATVSSVAQAAPIAPFRVNGKTYPQTLTRIDYYRPYYASPYYRPYYRPYYYNPYYIPYYYYGCRRFYSWGYLHCVW
jgi:hypothetical protein